MALSRILEGLEFKEDDFKQKEHSREYESKLGTINFVELAGTDEEISENFYDSHREVWNEDASEVFVTIINDEDVLICDSKAVPNRFKSEDIKTAKIDSFEYGKNTEKEEYYLDLLKKESIDSGYFWEAFHNYIKKKIKKGKRRPIDIDLLENLRYKKSRIKNYLRPVEPHYRECLVNDVISDCVALLSPEMAQRKITCRLDLDPKLPIACTPVR